VDPTDRRLLDLLRAGASGAEAAERVGITPRAAAARLKELRDRLGVTSTRSLLDALDPGEPDGR
jgi:DNA-binding Lrp family transcriptional regulator